MSNYLPISSTTKFEVEVQVQEDVTRYGNRFLLQILDEPNVDLIPLKSLVGLKYRATVFLEVREEHKLKVYVKGVVG